jgi:hypothetical protein
VVRRQFFRLSLALSAAGTHQYDFSAQPRCGTLLDGRRIVWHHHYGFYAESPGSISDALAVVAAGVSDDSTIALMLSERRDFVVGSPKFESSDGLLVFRLQVESSLVIDPTWLVNMRFDERSANGYAAKASLSLENVA